MHWRKESRFWAQPGFMLWVRFQTKVSFHSYANNHNDKYCNTKIPNRNCMRCPWNSITECGHSLRFWIWKIRQNKMMLLLKWSCVPVYGSVYWLLYCHIICWQFRIMFFCMSLIKMAKLFWLLFSYTKGQILNFWDIFLYNLLHDKITKMCKSPNTKCLKNRWIFTLCFKK